jgi:DNA polymerase III sliding clamp (beta) subunit (PCNA family)
MKSTIDSLVFKATDMEKHIEMTIPAQIKGEGSITINAKTFTNIIKSIEEEQVQLLVENEMLTIKSTKDKFEIKGIAASEYVALPEVHSDNQLEIDAASFITGVEKVEYTVSEKNFSPVLTGVYIRVVEINNQKFLVFV